MTYTIRMWVDGMCYTPANGESVGVAAATVEHRNSGVIDTFTAILPMPAFATNSRADLMAIILALEQAKRRAETQQFLEEPMRVTIYTTSAYAYRVMTSWIAAHIDRDCREDIREYSSAQGGSGNRDLTEDAVNLQTRIEYCGTVDYEVIEEWQNQNARDAVDWALDAYVNGHY
jgi:ribonuclease HI